MTPEELVDFGFRCGLLHARARVLARTEGKPDVVDPRQRDAMLDGWNREFSELLDEARGDVVALNVLGGIEYPGKLSPEGLLERMPLASELPC